MQQLYVFTLLFCILVNIVCRVVSVPVSGLLSWNSYDTFGGAPNETQLYDQAAAFNPLLIQAGYQTLVIDAGWNGGSESDPTSAAIDAYGRFIPSPDVFPSTSPSGSFVPVTQKLSAAGLGLGLFIFRGIPTAAVAKNTPILNSAYYADDIALASGAASACSWTSTIRGLNISHPAAFDYYRSLALLYLQWNIAVIKADCFTPLDDPNIVAEMNLVADAFQSVFAEQKRSFYIIFAPGDSANLDVVKSIATSGSNINSAPGSFRITSDLWDDYSYFLAYSDIATAYIPFIGNDEDNTARADLDILPFGVIGVDNPDAGAPLYPRRKTNLTPDQQISIFAFWSIFGSPLTIGGDLISLNSDSFTLTLLSDPIALQAQKTGRKRHEAFRSPNQSIRVWTAAYNTSSQSSQSFSYESSIFVAFFNTASQSQSLSLYASILGLPSISVLYYNMCEAFSNIQNPTPQSCFILPQASLWTVTLNANGARLFQITSVPAPQMEQA